jgi:hypothetical protein
MDIIEIGCERVDCVHLTQDREEWRAVVNTVMNLRVPYKTEDLLTVFQEAFSFVELDVNQQSDSRIKSAFKYQFTSNTYWSIPAKHV